MTHALRGAALALAALCLNVSLAWSADAPVALAEDPVQAYLANGLRVVYQSNPASPVTAICAFVHTSAAQETFNGAGVRELLQYMGERTLLRPDAPAQSVPPVMDVSTSLSRDYVEMVTLCLPEEVPEVLLRLRGALFDPYFSKSSLEFAQQRLLQSVLGRQSLAATMALDVLVARLYPDWPGSWPLVGTGGATQVTLDYVRAYHTQHYLPNRTLLAVAGPGDWADLRRHVEAAFGSLIPGKQEPLLPPPVGADPKSGETLLPMAGSDISAVAIGGRGPSLVEADYPAASVLTAILATGRGSRLYRRLREEENLSYSLQAGVTPSQVCPYIFAVATCAPEQAGKVRLALTDELRKLAEAPPTEDEVVRARRMLWGQYQLQQQDGSQLAHYLGLFAILDEQQGPARWSSLPLRLAAVRPEQVQALARRCFAAPVTVVVQGRNLGAS